MDKQDLVKFNSFNCRDLHNSKKKRNNIFLWLKRYDVGITLLQETHSVVNDEPIWAKEWNGQIIFLHGCNYSRGVAILIPPNFKLGLKILCVCKDTEGRILLIECNIEKNNFVIINIYSPTKDKQHKQLLFMSNLKNIVEQYSDKGLSL